MTGVQTCALPICYDEQISIFTDMSDAEQIVLVSDMLADNDAGLYDRLLKAYLSGDIATIEAEAMDWSNVSDLEAAERFNKRLFDNRNLIMVERVLPLMEKNATFVRSEEHTSELQSLMRISYAVFC